MTNVRNMCKDCWREIHEAGPDEKPPNFKSTSRNRMYASYWCGRCGKSDWGYVECTCPEGIMWIAKEQPA